MTHRLQLTAILLLFGALGVWYSLVVPPFETPDEPFHYAFARHLAQGRGLPVQRADTEDLWAQEGSQAPLYYMLTAAFTSGIDQSDYESLATRNPRANIGDPLYPGNKNFMLYSGAPHALTGANLALHVGRWFSLLLGGLTVFFTHATARLAWPNRPGLAIVSTLLVALIPQFLFLSASFSNDNLIIAASSATVYWLARLLVTGQTRPIQGRQWLVLGCLLGIAALSKLQGLGLFGLASLSGLWIARQRRDWRLPLKALLPVALPALLIAGWWYWRNQALYGDWLGVQHLLEINGQRERALSWPGLWGELRGLRYSFWGLFGWFNVPLPTWVYRTFDLVMTLAVVGQALQLVQLVWPRIGGPKQVVREQAIESPRDIPPLQLRTAGQENDHQQANAAVLMLLAAWALLSLGLLAYWIFRATGSQGRLLFPALSSLVILTVWGLHGWQHLLLPRGGKRLSWIRLPQLAWAGLSGFMMACSLYTLLFLLPTAYRMPAPVAAIPAAAQQVDVTYGDSARGQDMLRLLALAVGNGRYTPGDAVPVTLYLSADEPVRDDYQLFIQLLDSRGEPLANLTTHPGWGRNPTSLWRPGAIYADAYSVRIERPIGPDSPLLARVYTGFITPSDSDANLRPMRAHNGAGEEITPFLSSVAIRPWRGPDLAALQDEVQATGQTLQRTNVLFGHAIGLSAFALPVQTAGTARSLTLTLLWEAQGEPDAEYTAFVHLLNTAGEQVAGFDQPPAPQFPTSHWQNGDQIVSRFTLELPPSLAPGSYEVRLGLYEPASLGAIRLPVRAAGTETMSNGELLLGDVAVE